MKTITRYIGDIKPFTILVRNASTKKAIDITGMTIMISVKVDEDDDDNEAMFYDAAVPHINETSGLARTANVTFNWTEGKYLMQVRIVDVSGQIVSSDKGYVVIEKSLFKEIPT